MWIVEKLGVVVVCFAVVYQKCSPCLFSFLLFLIFFQKNYSIGHFAGHFPTTMSSFVNGGTLVDSDWQAWAYAGVFVLMVVSSTVVQFKTTSDRNAKVQQEKYKNSLLYGAPTQRGQKSVYVDHVSGYNTAV